MRLAGAPLLADTPVPDRSSQASECAPEKLAICVRELRREIRAGNELFRLRDSIRERRAPHIEPPHADLKPLQPLAPPGDWSYYLGGKTILKEDWSSSKANPLYLSSLNDFEEKVSIQAQKTLAYAIQIGDQVRYEKAVQALRESDGIVEEATEHELATAAAMADRTEALVLAAAPAPHGTAGIETAPPSGRAAGAPRVGRVGGGHGPHVGGGWRREEPVADQADAAGEVREGKAARPSRLIRGVRRTRAAR